MRAMPFVYCIAWSVRGPTKVGKASNVPGRLAELQVACPYRLRVWGGIEVETDDQAFAIEADCHRALSQFALLGEWFRVAPKHARATMQSLAGVARKNWEPTPAETAARAKLLTQYQQAAAQRRLQHALAEARDLHKELGGRRWT